MYSCSNEYAVNFKDEIELYSDEIWVAGGVYGNIFAIKKLNEMADKGNIIYNGDLHWFDADLKAFNDVESNTQNAVKLNGNVEIELKRAENLGCGCDYPEYENEVIVKNAELIHARLKSICADFSIFNDRGTSLVANVGSAKIAITHGDEKRLNGWGFDHESFANKIRQDEVAEWFKQTKFDILATSHTCKALVINNKNFVVLNNGSAGMPNFSEFAVGLVGRISTTAHEKALYRSRIKDVYVELVMLRYDKSEFIKYFERIWSDDSPASISYKARILGYGCPLSYKGINFGGFNEV